MFLAKFLIAVFVTVLLTGCGPSVEEKKKAAADDVLLRFNSKVAPRPSFNDGPQDSKKDSSKNE